MKMTIQLNIYFADPFWVGVFERHSEGKLEAARVVFGAEPKDYEVYEFCRYRMGTLHFSPPIQGEETVIRRINPKRMQRAAAAATEQRGISTKAQIALSMQREVQKQTRTEARKVWTEEEKQRKFELRQEKKKAKHRGH